VRGIDQEHRKDQAQIAGQGLLRRREKAARSVVSFLPGRPSPGFRGPCFERVLGFSERVQGAAFAALEQFL